MAIFITDGTKTVATNSLVPLTGDSRAKCIVHDLGSGQVGLRGLTKQCSARYRVSFTGNLAASTAGGAITLALTNNGEVISGASMTVTPANASNLFNVSAITEIVVPQGMTTQVAVKNTSSQSVTVDGTLAVTRIA